MPCWGSWALLSTNGFNDRIGDCPSHNLCDRCYHTGFYGDTGLDCSEREVVWLQGIGIVISALGVLLVITDGNLVQLYLGKFGTLGDFLILISAPNWAVFSVLSRWGLQKYPATLMMFYVMSFGWLFSLIWFFSKGGLSQIGQITLDGGVGIAFLGVICSGLAYIFWYDALQALPVA